MTSKQANQLVEFYFRKEGYQFPKHFECRFDEDSSALLYSLIRKYQPISILAIGTWWGGSTHLIMEALKKNEKKFIYVASELLGDQRIKTEKNVRELSGQAPVMIGDITKNLDKVPKTLDFLFIDTDHDFETTDFIVKNIFPRLKKRALVAIHDFAVEEKNGRWIGKGREGIGGLPETQYYMDMYHQGTWPLKKIYWMYKNPYYDGCYETWEGSFWENDV